MQAGTLGSEEPPSSEISARPVPHQKEGGEIACVRNFVPSPAELHSWPRRSCSNIADTPPHPTPPAAFVTAPNQDSNLMLPPPLQSRLGGSKPITTQTLSHPLPLPSPPRPTSQPASQASSLGVISKGPKLREGTDWDVQQPEFG